jgi:hypothetical protein
MEGDSFSGLVVDLVPIDLQESMMLGHKLNLNEN